MSELQVHAPSPGATTLSASFAGWSVFLLTFSKLSPLPSVTSKTATVVIPLARGLDIHTGFIVNNGDEVYFIHSSYVDQFMVVQETKRASKIEPG